MTGTNIETFDAVVLGCGEGGKYLAWHLGGRGERVAVIDERYVGGSCPNIACLPSKNIIHGAAIAHTVATSELFGTRTTGFAVSMNEVQARKRAMVEALIAMHRRKLADAKNELVMGRGVFVGARTIAVTATDGSVRTLRGTRVFLDLGAFATLPAIPGLADVGPMTHVELLDRETLPPRLVVLGGGYVGLELAQAMARLGSHVTIVEAQGRILPREDQDIAAAVTALLQTEGITVVTGAVVDRVSGRSGHAVSVHATIDGNEVVIEGTDLLVALGKAPNTRGIGLERTGVELTDAGYIRVNERLESTATDVWALGDCAGSPPFTHVSFEDFRIIRDNLAGGTRTTTGRQIPSCLFLEPELARIGMNEQDARHAGVSYRLAELPASAVLRTWTTGESTGKLKALVGTDDRILGFTAFAPRAGELLPPIQLAMTQDLPYRAVRDLVIAHPTYAEALVLLFGSLK